MQYDLLLEASGAKFVALAGAYAEFAARDHTVGRLVGASGGAILAALIAAGVAPGAILAILEEKDAEGRPMLAQFLCVPPPMTPDQVETSTILKVLSSIDLTFMPHKLKTAFDKNIVGLLSQDQSTSSFLSFFEHGGWLSAVGLLDWLAQKLATGAPKGAATQYSAMTLAQFYAATQVELSLLVADATAGRMLVLNHSTAPNCPLLCAVRMSASVPLLWSPVVWQESWGPYRGLDISGHYLWDGSLLSDFPLELLIADAPAVTSIMGPKLSPGVLGLYADESLPVPPVATGGGRQPASLILQGRLDIQTMLWRLVDMATAKNGHVANDVFSSFVVALPAGSYSTVEFDMTDDRRTALFEAGRLALGAYLDAPKPSASEGAAAAPSPLAQRTANSISAAKELRDCRLPAALKAILDEPLQSLGFSMADDQVVDQYAIKSPAAFVFTAIRRGERTRILLHVSSWILSNAPEEEVTSALTYMGSAFRARTRELFICSENQNYLPAPFTKIVDQYWPTTHGIRGRFVPWDSLAALHSMSAAARQGELLKGSLDLEALLQAPGIDSDSVSGGAQAPELVLTGPQVGELQAALLSAYDRQQLREMVREWLDNDLDVIAGDGALGAIVFNLIRWAERKGKLRRLIDGALEENPGNPELARFVQSLT